MVKQDPDTVQAGDYVYGNHVDFGEAQYDYIGKGALPWLIPMETANQAGAVLAHSDKRIGRQKAVLLGMG